MLLDIRGVSKTYHAGGKEVRALAGVSLTVNAGEFVAVQGPSGCGKTTLLLVAGALLSPEAGQVQIGGEDPYALPPDRRARFRAAQVGFVFQQFHLVPYLSVFDNVLAASLAGDPAHARERAQKLLAQFGLSERAHHVPGELSTGERQRTALARALLNRPKLLLADEPTGNLDAENARIVLGHLKEFSRTGGVLLVTHDTRAVEFAQRVAMMDGGRLV
jgi:ABC-type lipoprotein export system ATPase subunit